VVFWGRAKEPSEFIKSDELLDQLHSCQLRKKACVPWYYPIRSCIPFSWNSVPPQNWDVINHACFDIISRFVVLNGCGYKCVLACASRSFSGTVCIHIISRERHLLSFCYTAGIIVPHSISDVKLRRGEFKPPFLIYCPVAAYRHGRTFSFGMALGLPTSARVSWERSGDVICDRKINWLEHNSRYNLRFK
jgi:hypothetical protein